MVCEPKRPTKTWTFVGLLISVRIYFRGSVVCCTGGSEIIIILLLKKLYFFINHYNYKTSFFKISYVSKEIKFGMPAIHWKMYNITKSLNESQDNKS